jgi:hypothetical protein
MVASNNSNRLVAVHPDSVGPSRHAEMVQEDRRQEQLAQAIRVARAPRHAIKRLEYICQLIDGSETQEMYVKLAQKLSREHTNRTQYLAAQLRTDEQLLLALAERLA